jgi:hypothetical protein
MGHFKGGDFSGDYHSDFFDSGFVLQYSGHLPCRQRGIFLVVRFSSLALLMPNLLPDVFSLVRFASYLFDARILLDFFSLFSVDQHSFNFSSGVYLVRVAFHV